MRGDEVNDRIERIAIWEETPDQFQPSSTQYVLLHIAVERWR